MKVRSSIRKICPACKLVRRGRKQFVICPANARHKQRQGLHTLAAPALDGLAPGGGSGAYVSPMAVAAFLAAAPASVGTAVLDAAASRSGGAQAARPSAAEALAALRAFATGAEEDDDL